MALNTERRRLSKELPPNLSDLLNKLIIHANAFIEQFDIREKVLKQIVREIEVIATKVKEMQKEKLGRPWDLTLFVPFTEHWNFVAAEGDVAVVNVSKSQEKQYAEMVEKLGHKFNGIIEPLKNELKEIKTTCEKLEQESTEILAAHSLSDMVQFQWILSRVSYLGKRSGGIMDMIMIWIKKIGDFVRLILSFFHLCDSEDKQLADVIIQSASQCRKIVLELDMMKTELTDFTKNT
ncbi:hypothetical protein EXN66_Car017308 [Channa argus]|uniref:Uncharacterized protein n=1 Tax=Channa argus TaxID=215402 RepID=A0A6G1QG08_CHAAH|nr:hypothetical protein EXN66_Car017308 [Channa argus]